MIDYATIFFDIIGVLLELLILRHYFAQLLLPLNVTRSVVVYPIAFILLSVLAACDIMPYWRSALYYLVICGVALTCYHGSLFWKLLISACFTLLFAGVEAVVFYVLIALGAADSALFYEIGLVISKIIALVVVKYLAGLMTKSYYSGIKGWLLLIFLMPLTTLIVMYLLFVMSIQLQNDLLFGFTLLSTMLLLGSNQFLLYIFIRQIDNEELSKKLRLRQHLLKNSDHQAQQQSVIRQNILLVQAAYLKEGQTS